MRGDFRRPFLKRVHAEDDRNVREMVTVVRRLDVHRVEQDFALDDDQNRYGKSDFLFHQRKFGDLSIKKVLVSTVVTLKCL